MDKSNTTYRQLKNKFVFYAVCILSGTVMIPLLLIIGQLVQKGYKQFNFSLFTELAPSSTDAMLAKINHEVIPGGIVHGILGSALMLGVAIVLAIPIGILVGVYLAENNGKRFASIIRNLTDLLQGVPSIVIGIIVYIWVVKPMSSFSALAGSIALAIMMLPMIIRSTEESIKMLPSTLKEAGLALGGSYTTVVLRILIPSAFGGVFTGSLLAISRVMGETAPLLVTALGASMINWDITKPTSSIPLLIWEFYNNPNLANLIWASSLLLLVVILSINIFAKSIANKWKIQ